MREACFLFFAKRFAKCGCYFVQADGVAVSGRPLHSWPSWLLDVVLRFGIMRGLWAEVFIEKHHRAVELAEAAVDALANESGPYRVGPIRGMH